ncbi:MAG: alpha-L-rhamnosidase, partial [Oleiharenicola lentus]
FIVHVTGDARYQLWVNGRAICRGPQASDPQEWRYESVDLAPWLQAGSNVIGAQVRSYGDLAPFASMGWRTGFLLQGDTAAERMADTGSGWKVLRAASYTPFEADRAALHTFVVVSRGDRLDAGKHPWGWQQPGFDDTGWLAVRTYDFGKPRGWGTDLDYWLKPRSIPLLEEKPEGMGRVVRTGGSAVSWGHFPENPAPVVVPAGVKASLLLDRGHLTNAYPQLTVSGGRGATVTLRYAEALFDAKGAKGQRDETEGRELRGLGDQFLPDGGAHRLFAPMDFRTYRYLQLDIETGPEPLT